LKDLKSGTYPRFIMKTHKSVTKRVDM